MIKEYTMLSGQSVFDLALLLYGDITQVFRILDDNPELDNILSGFPGLVIQYEEQSLSITEFYKDNKIDLASGFPEVGALLPPTWILGLGLWDDGAFWIDTDVWID